MVVETLVPGRRMVYRGQQSQALVFMISTYSVQPVESTRTGIWHLSRRLVSSAFPSSLATRPPSGFA
jgi:hypothetical protein